MREVGPGSKRNFRNASGGKMENYGETRSKCGVEGRGALVGMVFQVRDAKNPLIPVAQITEKGNIVQFGPDVAGNFIYIPATDETVIPRRKRRKYIMDVEVVAETTTHSGQA